MLRPIKWPVWGLVTFLAAAMLITAPNTVGEEKDDLELDKIPKNVMETLKARFPKATIHKWTQEEEDSVVIYDIEFTQEGRKFEADIRADGSISNWEREITPDDLPEPVVKMMKEKYPESTPVEIMRLMSVNDGEEEIEGYELVFKGNDNKLFELTVSPDGEVLEEDEGD